MVGIGTRYTLHTNDDWSTHLVVSVLETDQIQYGQSENRTVI